MGRVVVVGAGVGGLGAAIGLAEAGHDVTLVERDPPPPTDDGDEAFAAWDRRHVPQFRQAHAFSARSRNLLVARVPAALQRLHADGVEEINHFRLLAPPELHRDDDDAFTALLSRRPAFELALRRTAQETPGVRCLCPAVVAGLLFEVGTRAPTVRGVRLESGEELAADVVIDAGGRRSPVVRWLRDAGAEIPEEVQDCHLTYHTRYFRQAPGSELPQALLFAVRSELDGLMVLGFPGDHGTYGITIGVPPWDDGLRALRRNEPWNALAGAVPSSAPWVDPVNGAPLNDVDTMAGHQNVLRRPVVDGEPAALGVLLVGDSLCTTNPAYGWGASMALTYAFAAVDALAVAGDDLAALALAYDAAVADEADAVYRESAAMDRIRTYRWRGEPVPAEDAEEAERQSLIVDGIMRGALRDADLGRALLRRINLLESPRAALDDPVVRRRAEEMRAHYASRPPRRDAPDRDRLLELVARA